MNKTLFEYLEIEFRSISNKISCFKEKGGKFLGSYLNRRNALTVNICFENVDIFFSTVLSYFQ